MGLRIILHCLRFETPPTLEGQVPVFISPRNWVSQLYPQALCSHFIASYDPQGYGRGIRTCLHTGRNTSPRYEVPARKKSLFYYLVFYHWRENNVSTELFPSNGFYAVACLRSCCLSMGQCAQNKIIQLIFPLYFIFFSSEEDFLRILSRWVAPVEAYYSSDFGLTVIGSVRFTRLEKEVWELILVYGMTLYLSTH
jgi:hypothetical protein